MISYPFKIPKIQSRYLWGCGITRTRKGRSVTVPIMAKMVSIVIWSSCGSHNRLGEWYSTGSVSSLRMRYWLSTIWMEGFTCHNGWLWFGRFLYQPSTTNTTEDYALKANTFDINTFSYIETLSGNIMMSAIRLLTYRLRLSLSKIPGR